MKHSVPIEIVALQEGDYHIFTTMYAGRKKLRMLIDTGASKTILTKESAENIKSLKLTVSEHIAAGLGTNNMKSWTTEIKSFRLGKLVVRNYVCGVLDLSHVRHIYEQLGLPFFDGIIGCDFLINNKIIIDLKKSILVFHI
jgi:predicted aspartyl protease